MKLEQHILKSIDDFELNPESSLMHACIAIDGTARNIYGHKATNKEYKECIRNYYWILEAMLGGGIDLSGTVFNNLKVDNGKGGLIINPDLADVIYHIFRCKHSHAEEVPLNYELLPYEDGRSFWKLGADILKTPKRIIWALLAVSVFAKANSGIKTGGEDYLTWGSETLGLGIEKFIIKDSWGKEDEFKLFLAKKVPHPTRVKLVGLDRLKK